MTKDDDLCIFTPPEDEQCWKKEFLKEIREKYNVIYDGKGCYAVRIIPRKGLSPLLRIMVEDDGALYDKNFCFDIGWTDDLIEQLQKAKEYAKEHFVDK